MYNRFETYVSLGSMIQVGLSGSEDTGPGWGWDLGLNATSVSWSAADTVEVYYDFSTSESLADFEGINGETFTWNSTDETMEVFNGAGSVDAVRWKQQGIVSEVSSSYFISVGGRSDHLNVYVDVNSSWSGTWNVNPGLAMILGGNFWDINGYTPGLGITDYMDITGSLLFEISPDRGLTNQTGSMSASVAYEGVAEQTSNYGGDIVASGFPGYNGYVGIGAYSTDTIWGNVKFVIKVQQ